MTKKKLVKKLFKRKTQREGTLIIVGGHEDKDGECVILKEIAKLVNGGKLIISTVASEQPDEYFKVYKDTFHKLETDDLEELYVSNRKESMDLERLASLDTAAGIYFTGGDQLRISSQIGDTPFETKVWEIYERGGVVAGTSAGASVMAEVMLVRGSGNESYKIGDVHLAPGLGLMPNVIIDQHFAERGRIGRLLGAVALNPRILGIGIDEDTAIMVHPGRFSVIGNGAVYVVDGADVSQSNIVDGEADSVLSLFGVRMHVLSSGDSFDLKSRKPKKQSK